jgi:hypothetical protein
MRYTLCLYKTEPETQQFPNERSAVAAARKTYPNCVLGSHWMQSGLGRSRRFLWESEASRRADPGHKAVGYLLRTHILQGTPMKSPLTETPILPVVLGVRVIAFLAVIAYHAVRGNHKEPREIAREALDVAEALLKKEKP